MGIRYDRVAEAIEVLEYVYENRPRKFFMGTWLDLTDAEEEKLMVDVCNGKNPTVAINGCGTQACALGWIASSENAIKQGLHVEFGGGSCEVVYKRRQGAEAGARYFGITVNTACILFGPQFYKHESGRRAISAVIARLRCLMDAPTPQLGELAVADAALRTGAYEYQVEEQLIDEYEY